MSKNLPSYRVPSGYQNVPWPYLTPRLHSPSYRAPFLNTYNPWPCLNPLQYWPTYISLFGSRAFPWPCLSPCSFRSPSYSCNYCILLYYALCNDDIVSIHGRRMVQYVGKKSVDYIFICFTYFSLIFEGRISENFVAEINAVGQLCLLSASNCYSVYN